jgi:succinoglycan biosynthesis transport protein ExoP
MSNVEAPPESAAKYSRLTGKPLDMKGLVDAFVRRWKLFVAVALGIFLVAVTASLVLRPVYGATTTIRIDPNQKSMIDLEAVARGAPPDQALVDSEVKIMQSRDVAREVVERMQLTRDPEFNPTLRQGVRLFGAKSGGSPVELTTDNVLKRLDVARMGSTYIVGLRFKSESGPKATNIANALAREYLLSSVQSKVQTAAEQSNSLTERLREASSAAQQADAALAQYKANNGIVASSQGGTVTEQQISTLTSQLGDAESAAAAARSNYQAARAQMAQGGIESVSTVLNSPTIVEMRRQRADLQRARAEVDARYGPKHPETLKVQQQVAGLDAQIRDESMRIITSLESDARAADAKADSLRHVLAGLKGELETNSRASVEADSLQRDAEAKRTIFNQLAASAQQVQQQEHISEAQARIISLASVPTKPFFPNRSLFAALGASLGLILGVGAVLVAEFLDDGLRTVEEIESELGVNYITSAPLLTTRALTVDGKLLAPWDYVVARPMSSYAEAMRTARSAIMLSDIDKKQKVVAITSALPNEGKTVCSVSLARIMAMTGEKVILVDCDLRRNALEGLLEGRPKAGLIEVLQGQATLDSVIETDPSTGLDVLPLQEAAFTPRDLFGTKSMGDLLAVLRERYDHVILDGPPVLAVTDARTLATLADVVLVVAHWNRTPRHAVRAALDRLQRDKAPIAGLMLTMVDGRSRLNADSYYYGGYHKYYHD